MLIGWRVDEAGRAIALTCVAAGFAWSHWLTPALDEVRDPEEAAMSNRIAGFWIGTLLTAFILVRFVLDDALIAISVFLLATVIQVVLFKQNMPVFSKTIGFYATVMFCACATMLAMMVGGFGTLLRS